MRLALLAASAWIAAAGFAAADTIESLYGNTLQVTYPGGNVERFHVDAGGGFTLVLATGQSVSAQWERQGDQFCVVAEGAPPGCSDFPMDKSVGDSWEQTRADGAVVRYEIVEGR
ncbi:MAG: hypothetical protein R3C16_11255 [Hyphomonadaceae bacterium]